MSPLSTPPLTATGAARTSWPKGRFAAVNRGGSAQVVLTRTSATAKKAMIALKRCRRLNFGPTD
jgi:hypothetical protein